MLLASTKRLVNLSKFHPTEIHSITARNSSKNKHARGELPQEKRLSGIDNKSHSSDDPLQYSLEQFHRIIEEIKYMRHRVSTRLKYHEIWTTFNKFLIRFDRMPMTWEDRIYVYTAHLVDNKKSINTVKSYLSAIRQILKSDGVELHEDKDLLSSLLTTCKIKNKSLFIRMPIKFKLLKAIIDHTHIALNREGQYFLGALLKSMFSMAYFGLLRVGEMVKSQHQIKLRNVHFAKNKSKVTILLESSKTHSKTDKPQKITLPEVKKLPQYCPVSLLKEYLKLRRNIKSKALFVLRDGQPISAAIFRNWLRKMLKRIGLSCKLYDTHSFRSGRCCDLRKLGYSLSTIKKAGRWISSAILVYLKLV